MSMAASLRAGLALLLPLACVNPNTYAVPRTIPKNTLEFLVAPEVAGFGGSIPDPGGSARLVPALPTVGIRYGLSERWDVGARFSNLFGNSFDLKWNPLESPSFDLALVPGVQFYNVVGVGDGDVESFDESQLVFITHLPVLLGINLSRAVSLVPSLGLSYAFTQDTPADATDIEQSQIVRGAFARVGLGVDLRLTDNFAVHPELTVLRGIGEMDGFLVYMGGVGFVFGRLPVY